MAENNCEPGRFPFGRRRVSPVELNFYGRQRQNPRKRTDAVHSMGLSSFSPLLVEHARRDERTNERNLSPSLSSREDFKRGAFSLFRKHANAVLCYARALALPGSSPVQFSLTGFFPPDVPARLLPARYFHSSFKRPAIGLAPPFRSNDSILSRPTVSRPGHLALFGARAIRRPPPSPLAPLPTPPLPPLAQLLPFPFLTFNLLSIVRPLAAPAGPELSLCDGEYNHSRKKKDEEKIH